MVRSTTSPQRLLVDLGHAVHGRALVGGKGASLSTLAALDAPVPKAVALTTTAYTTVAAALGLPSGVSDATAFDIPAIRARLFEAPLPSEVSAAIAAAHRAFDDHTLPAPALAVRSSATAEDASAHSFAGLHDSVLDVRSPAALELAVRATWASLWSDRALSYRRDGNLADERAEIAVVIQRLVRSDVSFVVFTADPVSGNAEHVVISASWGLGEAIVSGAVTPDHIVVGPDGQVVEHTIGRKHVMVIPGDSPHGGTREVPVPRALQAMPALSAEGAAEIAAMARALSGRLGYHADLEGGIADREIYLFQARPITTLKLLPEPAITAEGATPSNAPAWDPTYTLRTA